MSARGHVMAEIFTSLGEVQALAFDPKKRRLAGGSDYREGGVAGGY